MSDVFTQATAVERLEGDDPIRYDAMVHDGWDIGGHANGGYMLAIAGRAMADAVGRPPMTITAHYLRPVPAGPCSVDVRVVRTGKRLVTAPALLTIESGPALQLVGTFGDQTPGGPSASLDTPVDLPDYDDCLAPPGPGDGPGPSITSRLAMRLRPGDEGFMVGRPNGRAEVAGWFAFADVDAVDAIGLLLVSDAFPPAVFNSGLPVAWVPTVELTVHVRGIPAPGPLRCVFRSRFIHDGMLDEEGEIWDSGGKLVAQSRQLALMPR